MNRLTKVVSIHANEPEFYEANIDLYPEMMGYEHQQAEMDCINKLGQLEDIEEKHSVLSLNDLDNRLAALDIIKEHKLLNYVLKNKKCANMYHLSKEECNLLKEWIENE